LKFGQDVPIIEEFFVIEFVGQGKLLEKCKVHFIVGQQKTFVKIAKLLLIAFNQI
jgi:hypothetical protein